MLNAGGVCCSMLRPLVQSSDTHGRVVATLVCLQHLGSRGRFAHAPRIFRERTRGASYCRSFSFSDRPLFVTGNLAETLRWFPPPACRLVVKPVGRTALAITTFLMLPMFQYGPAVFRTSDLNISDAALRLAIEGAFLQDFYVDSD